MCEVQNEAQNASENVNKDKAPETLYHYCSLDTFYNIVKNKSIWLSDLSKTNDSQELVWLRKVIQKKLFPKIETNMRKDKDNFWGWDFARTFLNKEPPVVSCWGFCLSKKEDDLGQWRGYGDNGAGVAIGFKPLVEVKKDILVSNASLVLGKIHYLENWDKKSDTEHEDQELAELRRDACIIAKNRRDELLKFVNNSKAKHIPKIKLTPEIERTIVMEMAAMTRFPFYKGTTFKEEEEWRIVFSLPEEKIPLEGLTKESIQNLKDFQWPPELERKPYEYIVRNHMLVSHFEMKFTDMKDVITSITIGPKAKVTEEDIKFFLKSNGAYNDSIKIEKSAASYR